jgi:hypothetical protein
MSVKSSDLHLEQRAASVSVLVAGICMMLCVLGDAADYKKGFRTFGQSLLLTETPLMAHFEVSVTGYKLHELAGVVSGVR